MQYKANGEPSTGNTKNLLKGIIPTFVNWTTLPGTLDDMVYEEYSRPLATPGVSAAGAKITYDLGSIQRILVLTNNSYSDMITWASKDGIAWRECTGNVGVFAGQYRYIEIRCGVHASVAYIRTLVYLL